MTALPYKVIATALPDGRFEAYVPAFGRHHTLVHGDTIAEALRQAETVGGLIRDIYAQEGLDLPEPDAT